MTPVTGNVAISIPFALSASGTIATEQSAVAQLGQRVTALASTQPGTRVMANGYGVDTANLLYAFDDPMVAQQLALGLRSAMKIYEPGATLTGLIPLSNSAGTGITAIQATAVPATAQIAAPRTSTVTVRADGTVITSS